MTSAPRNLTAAISMMLSVSACSPEGSPGVLAMSRPRIQAQQHVTRGPGRPAPMADAMLFFGGEFRSRRTKRRHIKDGIIAEAVCAARGICNDALQCALN